MSHIRPQIPHHKLTITVSQDVYKGLYRVVGKGKISRFLENLARPYVIHSNLDSFYCAMATDQDREQEAEEWNEGLINGFTTIEPSNGSDEEGDEK
jgi:hypothetical protein